MALTRNDSRPRTRYANVVSTLALAIAVGGTTAYAAEHLPKNSVGSAQIKKNAVRSADVRNGTLTSKDLAPGTIPDASTAGGPAGGVLGGTFPNPTFGPAAPGVAIAAVTSGGNSPNPLVRVYFNRFGGAPTVTRNGTGQYDVDFPGMTNNDDSNTVVVGNGIDNNRVSIATVSGVLRVTVVSSAGSLEDGLFSLVVYAATPTGATTPPPARP